MIYVFLHHQKEGSSALSFVIYNVWQTPGIEYLKSESLWNLNYHIKQIIYLYCICRNQIICIFQYRIYWVYSVLEQIPYIRTIYIYYIVPNCFKNHHAINQQLDLSITERRNCRKNFIFDNSNINCHRYVCNKTHAISLTLKES